MNGVECCEKLIASIMFLLYFMFRSFLLLTIDLFSWQVLSYFTNKLEQQQKNLAVPEVQEIVRQGVLQFRRDRLKV